MADRRQDPGFAPQDLTDDREQGDWKTRYPDPEAQKAIRQDAIYVTVLFFLCPLCIFGTWLIVRIPQFGLSGGLLAAGEKYAYSWFGGLFGGSLFDLKWLYHSVAHGIWNRDRRLWRLLAPHMSAGLAFVFVCLLSSGLLVVFDPTAMSRPSLLVAFSFMVGYFSDSALAKLADVAHSLFGTIGKKRSL